MLRHPDAAGFRHSRVALVFRTVIVDRAGAMPWCRTVVAEVVDADLAGTALLLTVDRTHLQFPLRALHRPTAGIAAGLKVCASVSEAMKAFAIEDVSYVGGQELIWDFHNALHPAALRYLAVDEIAGILTARNASIEVDP